MGTVQEQRATVANEVAPDDEWSICATAAEPENPKVVGTRTGGEREYIPGGQWEHGHRHIIPGGRDELNVRFGPANPAVDAGHMIEGSLVEAVLALPPEQVEHAIRRRGGGDRVRLG